MHWGWQPAPPSFSGPITADDEFGGFVLNTLGRPTPLREAIEHPLIPRASYAVQVDYGFEPRTATQIPIGPRVQVADATMPQGFRWESGFAIQIGASPGQSLLIWGGDQAGIGWADGSRTIAFPEGDYAPAAQGTAFIRVDDAGNVEATVAGLTLRQPFGSAPFRVGPQVVIGDMSDEPGADASVFVSQIVQFEPPGGVVLQ